MVSSGDDDSDMVLAASGGSVFDAVMSSECVECAGDVGACYVCGVCDSVG